VTRWQAPEGGSAPDGVTTLKVKAGRQYLAFEPADSGARRGPLRTDERFPRGRKRSFVGRPIGTCGRAAASVPSVTDEAGRLPTASAMHSHGAFAEERYLPLRVSKRNSYQLPS